MSTRTVALEVDLATTEGAGNVVGQSAIFIPPSSTDATPWLMHGEVHGAAVTRPYDADLES